MPGLDVEDIYETDSSDNEENHSKLLSSVSQLDSTQRIKPAQRKEIATEVSEYNLNKGLPTGKQLINVQELVNVLGKKPEHGVITNKIKYITKKSKVLPKPLEKPVEERLKRKIGFGKVKEGLRKWDAIVTRNEMKDRIRFPLNDKSMKMGESNEFLSQFKTPTPLEVEIAKVLNQEPTKEKNSDDEEFPLTLEEMMEKRKEMAQIRARLSYKQTRAQRQSKIKSKKYHRLLKREKLKQQLKEFELLQKTDPEAALKKLAELDKTRAQERASLRHRNTGKWAKNLAVRAKYDVETRKVLAEQLKMSRELTQKVSQLDSSDDEEVVVPVPAEKVVTDTPKATTDNPWMLDVSTEVQDFVSGYKKFWSEKGEEVSQNESKEKQMIEVKNKNKTQTEEKLIDNSTEVKKQDEVGAQEAERVKSPKKKEISPERAEISPKKAKVSLKKARFSPKKAEISLEKAKVSPKKADITPKKAKISPKKAKLSSKKNETIVSINPTSGVWIVTPVEPVKVTKLTKVEQKSNKNNKRKAEDIDTLFDELNEKLLSKASKKVGRIKKQLKRKEKKKKKFEKKKEETEFDLSLKSRDTVERADMDVGLLEGGVENDAVEADPGTAPEVSVVESSKYEPEIDPKKFIQIEPKRLNTHLPDNITGDDDGIDDEKAQQMIIEEAFEEDDVMAEFNEMKKSEEEKSKIEIETSLPGWGSWAGTGIVPKRRKKRLLVINLPPRKDKLKKDVIINENENPKLKNHLVKEVPHPFKSVDAFEASIRAPVGRDWIPETAHQKLIQKQIVTKLGTVIEPMSEEEIIKFNKKATKSPYQGKKKSTEYKK